VALDSVRAFDGPDDVAAIAEHCHRQLRATRGAALGAAEFDADRGTMRWLGVGNVEGRLLRRTRRVVHSLVPVAGIAGHDMPPLRVCELPIALGDLLLLATDGVSPRFADDLAPAGPCQAIAERILRRHGRAHDDALVLVARYLGGQG
jgi:phosphoserine phosphatase RsbX